MAMLVEGSDDLGARVYRSHYGSFDTVAFEVEASSMAEMEAIWNEKSDMPESETFMQRLDTGNVDAAFQHRLDAWA